MRDVYAVAMCEEHDPLHAWLSSTLGLPRSGRTIEMERLDIDLTVNPDTAHLYEELREAREEIARLRAENERIAAWAVRNLEDWLDHNGRQFAEQLWAACAVAALLAKPVCCHTPMVHQGYFTWRCERCGREERR